MPSQLWSREYFQLLPGPVAGYGKVLCQGLVLFLAVTGNSSVGPCLRGPLVCHRFSVLDLGLWRSLGQGPAGTFSPSPSCLCSLCLTLSAFGLEVSKAVVPDTGFLSSLGGGFWGGSSGQEVGFASALQCTQHPACRAPAPGTSGFLTLSTGQFRNKRPGEVQGAGSCPQPLHAVWPKNQTKTKNSIAIVSECALKEEVCVSSLRRGIICQQKAGCYSINPGNQVTQLYANVCTCREGVGQSLRKPRAALGRPGSQPGHQRITDPGSSNPGKPGRGQKGKGGGGRAAQC